MIFLLKAKDWILFISMILISILFVYLSKYLNGDSINYVLNQNYSSQIFISIFCFLFFLYCFIINFYLINSTFLDKKYKFFLILSGTYILLYTFLSFLNVKEFSSIISIVLIVSYFCSIYYLYFLLAKLLSNKNSSSLLFILLFLGPLSIFSIQSRVNKIVLN